MHELKSYDELSKIINDWLNGDIDSDTEGSGSTPAGASGDSDSETTDTDSKSYKNLDDAFADLMD